MKVKFNGEDSFEAKLITESNLETVAEWCRGRVRGYALPEVDRVVQWDGPDGEMDAEVDDWIVNIKGDFYKFSAEAFARKFVNAEEGT